MHGHRAGDMDMMLGLGLITWVGRLWTYSLEGMGSAQLICFCGCWHGMDGMDMLDGLGLIAWIGLGIGAFPGVCGIWRSWSISGAWASHA